MCSRIFTSSNFGIRKLLPKNFELTIFGTLLICIISHFIHFCNTNVRYDSQWSWAGEMVMEKLKIILGHWMATAGFGDFFSLDCFSSSFRAKTKKKQHVVCYAISQFLSYKTLFFACVCVCIDLVTKTKETDVFLQTNHTQLKWQKKNLKSSWDTTKKMNSMACVRLTFKWDSKSNDSKVWSMFGWNKMLLCCLLLWKSHSCQFQSMLNKVFTIRFGLMFLI